MSEVEFNHDNTVLVEDIVERWMDIRASRGLSTDLLSTMMDLKAANGVNGNPELDLGRLAGFDDANFVHDMVGIERHINRETGKVEGCFLPRCAISESEAA